MLREHFENLVDMVSDFIFQQPQEIGMFGRKSICNYFRRLLRLRVV